MKKGSKRLGSILLILFILLNALCIWQAYIFTHFSNEKVIKQKQAGLLEKKFDHFLGKIRQRQLVIDSLTVPHQSLFINSDSLKLAAWYLKHNADTAAKGTVIMFHGYNGSRGEMIPEATAFYKMNYNVFMIDFRAHGNSGGKMCSLGYSEAGDVRSAYNYIKNTGETNIILWGGSMGAASVIKAMYDDSTMRPSKVILEKSYGKMIDAVEALVKNMHEPAQPLATILTFWGSVEEGVWMYKMKPQEFVKKITCPALIQWGNKDENVSKQETENIYNNLGSKYKKLVVFPGAGHENLLLQNPSLWLNSVSSFLNSSAMAERPINK